MDAQVRARPRRIALLGNPNTGKTTLFNRLTGLRHKTANFPGTTLDARIGRISFSGTAPRGRAGGECAGRADDGEPVQTLRADEAEIIDLPGVYSLEIEQGESVLVRDVLAGRAAPRGERVREPDAICIVADATNLPRNLVLVGEALRRRLPTIVAVNMIDLARRRGLAIDADRLSGLLGCPVVCVSARTGEGIGELRSAMGEAPIPTRTPPGSGGSIRDWADGLYESSVTGSATPDTLTDRLDRVLTHPVPGTAIFAIVMGLLFWLLFELAAYPMGWIEAIFAGNDAWVGAWQPAWLRTLMGGGLTGAIEAVMPEGVLRDLVAQGVLGGVGATVVFLPQICLLFLVISLLEDTGYLARAALVMDRVLRPFGLPGHAFVPLLSSHACAIPGIMATRAIPDRRERLATILVAPFMTCSARLPVYVLVTMLLFPNEKWKAAIAFVACYALGIAAGMLSAMIARRTLLKGRSRPMALELPTYKVPSLRTALVTAYDRGLVFVRQAGTNILAICIVLWWLSAFPRVAPGPDAMDLRARATAIRATDPVAADEIAARAESVHRREQSARSFAGRIGRAIQPVFEPLGYDWKLTVGVVTSLAAREVFVSTMSVVVTGEEDGVIERIAQGTRDDGRPIFTPAVCWSLLAYYVLAMQCLPTLAVTAREAGGWRWAVLQQVWMTGLAYILAAVVYQVMK